MRDDNDHVTDGWTDDHRFRWIEAGGSPRLRLEEDDKGAIVMILRDTRDLTKNEQTWLSATELAGLARNLVGWFADDPSEALDSIEKAAKRVLTELEGWNDRARADEEHPPYEDLTKILHGLVSTCKGLRDDVAKFDKATKIITVAGVAK